MNLRQVRAQLRSGLVMLMVMASAFALWKGLAVVTNSSAPLVVVLSGSMEPAFQRGDILFLWNREKYLNVGDVVVYNVEGRDIPIVHRITREHVVEEPVKTKKGRSTGLTKASQYLLTKGDNNNADDLALYGYGKSYLVRDKDIIGSVKGYLPKLGYVTIFITENIYFKYAMIGLLTLSALFQE